jgi:DNA-binding MarR family transcriptional regulator
MQSKKYKFHLLLHSAHLLEERLRTRLLPLGVHPRQARVLDALGRMGKTSQVTLAKEFNLTAASMSTMTNRLLQAGLIKRQIDEHELRSNILCLSTRGKTLLDAIYREWREMDREISDAIGSENSEQLADLTYQLRNAIGGFTPGDKKKDEKKESSKNKT